jgi:hypothetical protein
VRLFSVLAVFLVFQGDVEIVVHASYVFIFHFFFLNINFVMLSRASKVNAMPLEAFA